MSGRETYTSGLVRNSARRDEGEEEQRKEEEDQS
jgi:hypothetical protein